VCGRGVTRGGGVKMDSGGRGRAALHGVFGTGTLDVKVKQGSCPGFMWRRGALLGGEGAVGGDGGGELLEFLLVGTQA
jgi:hypothetical protein